MCLPILSRSLAAAALVLLALRADAATWTRASADGAFAITFDLSGVPDAHLAALSNAAERAAADFLDAYPRVALALGVATGDFPHRVELAFRTDLAPGVPAATSGPRMSVAVAHALAHPDDLRGMFIHEWTHTIQRYPRPDPGWIMEGIADAVRLLMSRPDDPWRKRIEAVPRDRTDYHRGYGEAARFLLWIRDQGHPELLPALNAAMRGQACDATWWTAHTGQSVEAWWKQYVEVP